MCIHKHIHMCMYTHILCVYINIYIYICKCLKSEFGNLWLENLAWMPCGFYCDFLSKDWGKFVKFKVSMVFWHKEFYCVFTTFYPIELHGGSSLNSDIDKHFHKCNIYRIKAVLTYRVVCLWRKGLMLKVVDNLIVWSMNIDVLWDMTSCSLITKLPTFRRTLHFLHWRWRQQVAAKHR